MIDFTSKLLACLAFISISWLLYENDYLADLLLEIFDRTTKYINRSIFAAFFLSINGVLFGRITECLCCKFFWFITYKTRPIMVKVTWIRGRVTPLSQSICPTENEVKLNPIFSLVNMDNAQLPFGIWDTNSCTFIQIWGTPTITFCWSTTRFICWGGNIHPFFCFLLQ